MTVWFAIPMQSPASGRGTPQDPWRPKYLRETPGIRRWSMVTDRTQALVTIEEADESALSELRMKPDVRELNEAEAALMREIIFEAQRGAN